VDNLPRLVLGSADLRDDDLTPRLLDCFHAAGGRALDLANVYGDGDSSRAVGRWLRQGGRRDALRLYVKGCHPPFCSPSVVGVEVDRARSLLGIDTLDVFMLHRDDPGIAVAAFAEALLDQVERGVIQSFGVSNWLLPRFEALTAALGSEAQRLVVFSNHFSLATMVTPTWPGCLAMTKDDIVALDHAGVTALAWATLAGGFFAGRDLQSWESKENAERRNRAEELAAGLSTTAPAIAVAYVLTQPPHVLATIGTRSERHLDELMAATRLELSSEDVAWLEQGRDLMLP
jgi:aryl-alcohol dehydrogenase-like predicted oxidoreductase